MCVFLVLGVLMLGGGGGGGDITSSMTAVPQACAYTREHHAIGVGVHVNVSFNVSFNVNVNVNVQSHHTLAYNIRVRACAMM